MWKGNTGIEHGWHFQHFAQGLNCLLLNTAVPMKSMTMAFVERDECISSFLSISFLFLSWMSCPEKLSFWISSPELSYVCYTFAMPICVLMWAENS